MNTPSLFPNVVLISSGCSPPQTLQDSTLYTNMFHHVPALVYTYTQVLQQGIFFSGRGKEKMGLTLLASSPASAVIQIGESGTSP